MCLQRQVEKWMSFCQQRALYDLMMYVMCIYIYHTYIYTHTYVHIYICTRVSSNLFRDKERIEFISELCHDDPLGHVQAGQRACAD